MKLHMRNFKRWHSFQREAVSCLLAVLMIVSLVPYSSLTVKAEGEIAEQQDIEAVSESNAEQIVDTEPTNVEQVTEPVSEIVEQTVESVPESVESSDKSMLENTEPIAESVPEVEVQVNEPATVVDRVEQDIESASETIESADTTKENLEADSDKLDEEESGENVRGVSEVEEPDYVNIYFDAYYYYMFSDGEMTLKPVCSLSDEGLEMCGYRIDYSYQLFYENTGEWADLRLGVEYVVSEAGITIFGDKVLAAAGDIDTKITARVVSGDEIIATAEAYVDVEEVQINNPVFNDQQVILNDGISSISGETYVRNTEHPEGDTVPTPITNVELAEEHPENEYDSVIRISRDESYWYYEAVGCGDATLQVTYEDINGNAVTTSFNIHVVSERYWLEFSNESNNNQTLAGQSITLAAQGYVYSAGNGDAPVGEGYSYEWSLEEYDYPGIAAIHADDSGKLATVSFGTLPNGVDSISVGVTCKLFDGNHGEIASESTNLVASNIIYKLYTTDIKETMLPGEKQQITAEVRKYSVDFGDPEEYELMENIHFRWEDYNWDDFSITDSEGNPVGYTESYEYMDTDFCRGSQCTFTIEKLSDYETSMTLCAEWGDEFGNPVLYTVTYYFRNEQYDICFRDEEYTYWELFSDGEKTLKASVVGLSDEEMEEQGLSIRYSLQYLDQINDEWADFDAEGTYSVDESGITIDGEQLFEVIGNENEGYADILVIAQAVKGDYVVGETSCNGRVQKIYINYPEYSDEEMMLGISSYIQKMYEVEKYDAAHPYGEHYEIPIIDVSIMSQTPEENYDDVITLSENDYEWQYTAVGCGNAVLQVIYEDLEGNAVSTSFNVQVVSERYSIDIFSENNKYQTLPGKSITLTARGQIETAETGIITIGEGVTEEGYTYEWLWDNHEIAALTVEGEGNRATITFGSLPDDRNDESVTVSCVLYDENHKELVSNMTMLQVSKEYCDLYPTADDIDTSMLPGEEQEITAEVRKYSVDNPDGYSLVDNVHFIWSDYSYGDFEIIDAEGNQVGNNESGESLDSEASYGSQCAFTIRRLNDYDCRIELRAEWEVEPSLYETRSVWYYFESNPCNVRFEDENDFQMFTDRAKTLKAVCDMSADEMAEHGYELVYFLQYEDWNTYEYIDLDVDGAYSVSDEGITIDGALIYDALQNEDGDVYLRVIAQVTNGEFVIGKTETYGWIRESEIRYPHYEDREMMLHSGSTFSHSENAYIRNTDHPDGYNFIVSYTDFSVIEQHPEDGYDSVVRISDLNYNWQYDCVGCGDAVLQYTYEDIDGNEKSGTFNIHVIAERSSIELQADKSYSQVFTGDQISLEAVTYVESATQGYFYDHTTLFDEYQWEIVNGEEYVALQADSTSKNKAVITFGECPNNSEPEIELKVTAYNGSTKVSEDSVSWTLIRHYEELVSQNVEPLLKVNETREVDVELRSYTSHDKSDYRVIDNVSYDWSYDPEVVTVLDENGEPVGSGSSSGEGTVVGKECSFIIKRLGEGYADIYLNAAWYDENEIEYSCSRGYDLRAINNGSVVILNSGDETFENGENEERILVDAGGYISIPYYNPYSSVDKSKVFVGWRIGDNTIISSYDTLKEYIPGEDTTIYAVWEDAWKLTLDGNHGNAVVNERFNYERDAASVLELPVSKCVEGVEYNLSNVYVQDDNSTEVLKGWNTAADGSGVAYAVDGVVRIMEDTTLYAQWEEGCSITFHAGDEGHINGSKTETYTVKKGDLIRNAAYAYARPYDYENQVFLGWATTQGGDPVVPRTLNYVAPDQNLLDLWAVYGDKEENTIIVTCEFGDKGHYIARPDEHSQTFTDLVKGETLNDLMLRTVTFPSYITYDNSEAPYKTLYGWSLQENGEILDNSYKFTENTTIHAVWGDAYKVTLNAGEGTVDRLWYALMSPDRKETSYYMAKGKRLIDRDNYYAELFYYFVTAPENKVLNGWMDNTGETMESIETYLPTRDITFYASYENFVLYSEKTSFKLEEGDQKKLFGYVKPASVANEISTVWSSDNEAVAIVDEDGTITAVGAGEATITLEGTLNGEKQTVDFHIVVKGAKKGWVKEDNEWHFYNNDGSLLTNGWAKDSKGWCWMDASGNITKDKWIKSNGEWYYLKSNGYMAANEWAKDSGGWYWMGANGKITKDKWIQSGGEWYYLKSNGYMAANEWAKDGKGWYWMGANGKITKDKWIQSGGEWYYLKSDGYMAANEWAKDGKGWCWMGANGKITKDKWIQSNGEWYYLKSNGYMAANEWAKDSGGWYWMGANGKITRNKWIQSGGEWYYMKSTGYMAVNEWVKDSKGWCWMNASGKMTKSEWVKTGGAWYYLNASGYMITGKQTIGGKTYTFASNGKLQS